MLRHWLAFCFDSHSPGNQLDEFQPDRTLCDTGHQIRIAWAPGLLKGEAPFCIGTIRDFALKIVL
jgi:hypothetical protein